MTARGASYPGTACISTAQMPQEVSGRQLVAQVGLTGYEPRTVGAEGLRLRLRGCANANEFMQSDHTCKLTECPRAHVLPTAVLLPTHADTIMD
jgi:hypothetical protein